MSHAARLKRRSIVVALTLFSLAVAISLAPHSVGHTLAQVNPTVATQITQERVTNQVMVRFAAGVSITEQTAYAQRLGGQIVRQFPALNAVVIKLPDVDGVNAQSALPESPLVVQSEPDYYVSALQLAPPNDPLYAQQWALPIMGVPNAWSQLPANPSSIAVAVIDSGVCGSHPDLAGRLLPGYDFVENDSIPQDEFDHGCAIAGIIAAQANNALGIAGIAPHTLILPLRVLDSHGVGTYSNVAAAIIYAADHGARIINLSLGGANPSSILEDAINYAVGRGVLVIAAAGNTGAGVLYPAKYDRVIAVASIDPSLQLSSFSSRGPEVDLLAPGQNILTLKKDGGYGAVTGTSFAAPQVAGVAALGMTLGLPLIQDGGIVTVGGSIPIPTPLTPTPTPAPTQFPPGIEQPAPPKPTDQWAVIVQPGIDPNALAARLGYENLGQIGTLKQTYLFRIPSSGASTQVAQVAASALRNVPEITWFEQQVARRRYHRAEPIDPLYGQQWHLKNYFTGLTGQDANVVAAWNAGYDGTGVQIAIVDDGLQHTHPDLAPNYFSAGSFDFNNDDSDPSPGTGDGHGTSAAGVAAGRDDGTTCGVGAAYRANLAGIRLIAAPAGDAQEASALTYANGQGGNTNATNDIYSNSWGPSDDGETLEGPGSLTHQALQDGVQLGRGGLGNIFVWAAGNGRGFYYQGTFYPLYDNVNADGYANSRYVIAVSAVGPDGKQSYYSEPGAPILVTAPSNARYNNAFYGITTTDSLGTDGYNMSSNPSQASDCTDQFGGTSSATPLVSGVVALMLQANSNLGWRDVQHILAKSAQKNDPTDADWAQNGAGRWVNHKYGFGRVDAAAAVNLAQTWTNVGAELSATTGMLNVNQVIPQKATGDGLVAQTTIADNLSVEHVEVILSNTDNPPQYSHRGEYEIVLTSPSGTVSRLMEVRPNDDNNLLYSNWTFSSVHHWGEHSAGVWKLMVVDRLSNTYSGRLTEWQLKVYGTQAGPRPPNPLSPANNANIITSTPKTSVTLQWDTAAVFNADHYELQLDTAALTDSTPVTVLPGNPSSYTTTPLPFGTYHWRARAVDSDGRAAAWNTLTSRDFTLASPANAAPFNNYFTLNTPTLTWNQVSWAAGYEIQVDDSSSFLAPLSDSRDDIQASQPYYVTVTLPNNTYYWRVRARKANGSWGAWSAVERFTIDAP
jgi:subtilisin family serine protease